MQLQCERGGREISIDNIILNATCVKTINFDPYWYTSLWCRHVVRNWQTRGAALAVSNFSFTCQKSFFSSLLAHFSRSLSAEKAEIYNKKISSTRLRIINKYQKHIHEASNVEQNSEKWMNVKPRAESEKKSEKEMKMPCQNALFRCLHMSLVYLSYSSDSHSM